MGFGRKMRRAQAGTSGPSPAHLAKQQVKKLIDATKRDAAELSRRVASIKGVEGLAQHGREVLPLFEKLRNNADAIKQIQADLIEVTAFLDESEECAALREFREMIKTDD